MFDCEKNIEVHKNFLINSGRLAFISVIDPAERSLDSTFSEFLNGYKARILFLIHMSGWCISHFHHTFFEELLFCFEEDDNPIATIFLENSDTFFI